jgi:hypothetical protein
MFVTSLFFLATHVLQRICARMLGGITAGSNHSKANPPTRNGHLTDEGK